MALSHGRPRKAAIIRVALAAAFTLLGLSPFLFQRPVIAFAPLDGWSLWIQPVLFVWLPFWALASLLVALGITLMVLVTSGIIVRMQTTFLALGTCLVLMLATDLFELFVYSASISEAHSGISFARYLARAFLTGLWQVGGSLLGWVVLVVTPLTTLLFQLRRGRTHRSHRRRPSGLS